MLRKGRPIVGGFMCYYSYCYFVPIIVFILVVFLSIPINTFYCYHTYPIYYLCCIYYCHYNYCHCNYCHYIYHTYCYLLILNQMMTITHPTCIFSFCYTTFITHFSKSISFLYYGRCLIHSAFILIITISITFMASISHICLYLLSLSIYSYSIYSIYFI